MSFDIKKNNPELVAEVGYEFNLELPDGTKTDAVFKIRGDNSKIVKAHGRRTYKEMEAQRTLRKRKGQPEDLSLDELTDMAVEAAVVRVISFSGIQEDGVDLPCTPENIRKLMEEYDFARSQVLENAAQVLNFR